MKQRNNGVTLIEVTAAVFLAATTIAVGMQLLVVTVQQQRAAERRSWAIESATNLMERFTAQDYDKITPAAADQLKLSSEIAQVLTDPQLEIEVIEQQEPVAGKQIRLSLQWQTPHGQPSRKVKLSTWVFQNGRPAP